MSFTRDIFQEKELNVIEERGFEVSELLGKGSFSVVVKCADKRTGDVSAVKVVSLSVEAVRNEVELWKSIHHVNIVALYDAFETAKHMFIRLEYLPAGELFDHIVRRRYYSELDARFLMRQILSALEHMHERGIAHRDIKPENLLCAIEPSTSPNMDNIHHVKISDFGLAARITPGQKLTRACGTPGYVAPEVLKGFGYNELVDIWSIGVILYILLVGFPPFNASTDQALLAKCLEGSYEFPAQYFDRITPSAKDLITHLLCVNTKERFNATAALNHEWIALVHRPSNMHLEKTIDELKRFNAKRKFMGAAHAVRFGNVLRRIVQGSLSGSSFPAVDAALSSESADSLLSSSSASEPLSATAAVAIPKRRLSQDDTAPDSTDPTTFADKRPRLSASAHEETSVEFAVVDGVLEATVVDSTRIDYGTVGQVVLRLGVEGLRKAVIRADACPDVIVEQLASLRPLFDIVVQVSLATV